MIRTSRIMSTLIAAACAAFYAGGPAHGAAPPLARGADAGVFATDPGGALSSDKGPEGVAAQVDGRPILLRDVMTICLVKNRAPVIDQMVQNYVVEREAARKGIVIPESQIDSQVETLRKSVAPAALDDVIAQHHSTMAEVRAAFKHKIQRGLIVADQVPAASMVHCRVILIKFASSSIPAVAAGTSRDEAASLQLTHIVQTQLADGKDFGELAAKYSDDPSKKAAGDIGVLYPGIHNIDAGLVAAALVLDKGKVSDPVRTDSGFWLVQAVSTSADRAKDEDAAYQTARATYVEEQSQFLSPKYVVDLIDKSHITYATDAQCAPPPGRPLPEAAAIVDGHVIPMKEVAAKCLAENGPRTVDILVQNAIVDEECKRRGVMVTNTEVDQRIDKLRKLIAPHTLEEGLKARHITLDDLRSSFRQDMERTRLVIDQVKPAKTAHCRAILIKIQQGGGPAAPGETTRTEPQALALIHEIQAQLRAGKDFGALATQYSELVPKSDGGDLGVLYPGMHDMDTGILDAGLALGKGKTTPEPMKTVFGYCLVQSVSTSDDHAKSEDAAYAEALSVYKEQQAQMLVPAAIIAMIQKSKVVYYVHA